MYNTCEYSDLINSIVFFLLIQVLQLYLFESIDLPVSSPANLIDVGISAVPDFLQYFEFLDQFLVGRLSITELVLNVHIMLIKLLQFGTAGRVE